MNAASSEILQSVLLRPSRDSDVAFVFSSWLKSYEQELRGRLSKTVYFDGQHRVIERLLKRCHVVVACPSAAESDQILGWACAETAGELAILHYVYVKQPFRKLGIGEHLARTATAGCDGIHHTHETEDGKSLARRLEAVFNPFLNIGGVF